MTSVSRKICLLGDFAAGKTSTVARSARNTFSEAYLTTVGVKVDSKTVPLVSDRQVRLVLWDIAGASTLDQLRANYVVGTQGVMLVADGIREDTVAVALDLRDQVNRLLGRELPCVLLLNKADLVDEWAVPQSRILELQEQLPVFTTSAKTGEGVEEAFTALAVAVTS